MSFGFKVLIMEENANTQRPLDIKSILEFDGNRYS
jgi:hypothetical protein